VNYAERRQSLRQNVLFTSRFQVLRLPVCRLPKTDFYKARLENRASSLRPVYAYYTWLYIGKLHYQFVEFRIIAVDLFQLYVIVVF